MNREARARLRDQPGGTAVRYSREDGCRAWLAYGDISPEPMAVLLREYGSCEAVYDAFLLKGRAVLEPYAGPAQLDLLASQSAPDAMHAMMLAMQKLDMGILTLDDERYPDTLRNIADPPMTLFYRGAPGCLTERCVTVIGARKASLASVSATQGITRALSASGVHIVSGMAMGIDTAAMQGGLEGGSPVIGVLGCGLDVDYPVENGALKERIVASGGVLLSEYPPGTPALPWHFPVRNRIMSGLSRAVLMMEGRIRSGSMTTVQHALDQGREVYAYPGEAGTEWAEGAHRLLREGANYFTSAEDILEDMGWLSSKPTEPRKKELPPMSPEQNKVYALLLRGEMSYDQLAASSGLDTPSLSGALTMLQIMGLVRSLPGKAYKAV